jgi:2'-5' RNA ligase
MSSATSDARRLFLALWPGDRERRAIEDVARNIPAVGQIRADRLHLTLVFLGATHPDRLACYEAVLGGLRIPRIVLTLDRIGFWRRPRLLWLGIDDPATELQDLVGELNICLRGCGFSPEQRSFRPHVTLRRRFHGQAPTLFPGKPISWQVDGLTLVESQADRSGSSYRVLRRWASVPQG